MGGQPDELLASLAARGHVYSQLLLYCILFIVRWQINMLDWITQKHNHIMWQGMTIYNLDVYTTISNVSFSRKATVYSLQRSGHWTLIDSIITHTINQRQAHRLYSIQTYTAANNQFNVFITANHVVIDPAGLWWLATLSQSPITIEQNEVQVGRGVRTKNSASEQASRCMVRWSLPHAVITYSTYSTFMFTFTNISRSWSIFFPKLHLIVILSLKLWLCQLLVSCVMSPINFNSSFHSFLNSSRL